MEADGSLSSVTGECSGDDDPECFLAERLLLNVGRTPGATEADVPLSSVMEESSGDNGPGSMEDDDPERFLPGCLFLALGLIKFWKLFQMDLVGPECL